VSPNAFKNDLADLEGYIKTAGNCQIRSISGRFFAMDRDKRWERVESAYNAIALGRGHTISDCAKYVADSYASGITDEFIEPGVTSNTGFDPGDALVFFNFREDRMRELVSALCADSFDAFQRSAPLLSRDKVLCFTEYDHKLKLPFLFEQLEIKNHLGEVVAAKGIKQLRVAETEKYPHVTYFLNGGLEHPYDGEDRKLVASPRDVKTYDLKHERPRCS
jgi:2,3-bisphosphoglycerate-independent phosphoglycerate mutase